MPSTRSVISGISTGLLVAAAFATPASAVATSWSADHFLGRNASSPEIHVNASGAAVVSWTAYARLGQQPRAYVATKNAGGRWSAPRALSRAGAGAGQIWSGIGARGRSVVVWTVGTRVYWAQRAPRHSWSAARELKRQGVPTSFDMSLRGYAVIGFASHRHPYVRLLTPSGRWRAPVAVSIAPVPGTGAVGAHGVRAVVADDGTITAAWLEVTHDSQSGSYGDWQRGEIRSNGTRAAVHTLDRNVVGEPLITRSVAGDAIAIYSTFSNVPHTLTFRLDDGVWRNWTVPAEAGAFGQVTPALFSTRAVVWWTVSSHANGTAIDVADYAGGRWSSPTVVHHQPTGPDEAAGLALVAAVSRGQRLVAWTDGDQGNPRFPHSTVLRDRHNGRLTTYTWGARSTAESLSAVGGHAAFAWLGGPSRLGLRVRTR